jgi:hypothetical protein
MSTTQCETYPSDLDARTAEACEEAALYFTFVTGFESSEMWNSMSWWEVVRGFLGVGIAPIGLPYSRAGSSLIKRVFRGVSPDGGIDVLIAPVDVQLYGCEYEGGRLELELRPLETSRVRERLQRDCRAGKSLEEAVQLLQDELCAAARAPLFASQAPFAWERGGR